jgi:hypothetical protein
MPPRERLACKPLKALPGPEPRRQTQGGGANGDGGAALLGACFA